MTAIILFVTAGIVLGFGLYSFLVSLIEREKRAARRFLLLSLFLSLPFLASGIFNGPLLLSWTLMIAFYLSIIMVFVFPGRTIKKEGISPKGRIDERDTMFSREQLQPGNREYEEYYRNNPEKKPGDDAFRKNPGLLSSSAKFYRPWIFESAGSNFRLIEENRKYVDGDIERDRKKVDPESFSGYLKNLVKHYGAVSSGIVRLQDYHLYSYRGRSHNYGEPVTNTHQYAFVFTVEMNHDFVRNAPYALAVLESSRQYLRSGMIALQVAQMIRDLGYPARAHIDGEYEVVCPLVARDAGLGEIGRMGLLMTPELGPRVRIAAVTTSLPLIPDYRSESFSTIDFCIQCKKCAEVCPSNAIPFDDRREINGVLRWQIDQQACFTYWTRTGTDCARCMSVCPFSHPNNPLHNLVRYGIRNSSPFRKVALWMDDFIYGRKPRPLKAGGINSSAGNRR